MDKPQAGQAVRNGSRAGMTGTALRISNLAGQLSESDKRIAGYLLANPAEIVKLSITELAERCQVSEATVFRFSKKLSFDGYQDLKITLAQENVEGLKAIRESLSPEDDCQAIVAKVFSEIYNTLEHTRSVISYDRLEQAAGLILGARKVLVFGLGNSAAIALDAQHKFLREGIDCAAFSDNHMQALVASHMTERDVALGISHSGSSRDIVEALQIAREQGARTICITNHGKSPILKVSDVALFTASEETSTSILALSSRIAQLAIIDSLYVTIAMRRSQAGIEAIKKVERAMNRKKY